MKCIRSIIDHSLIGTTWLGTRGHWIDWNTNMTGLDWTFSPNNNFIFSVLGCLLVQSDRVGLDTPIEIFGCQNRRTLEQPIPNFNCYH
eukprot:UN18008